MSTRQAATTDQIRDAWDAIAPRFDEFATTETMTLAQEVLRRVELRAGQRLLDVAAGSGGLSLPAARIGADVVATDLAPTMIERLNARARTAGLANIDGRVMDGHALDFDDDAFDVAVSINGVSLFPDLPRGLAELARVTRPGGRVAIAAFGAMQKAEFIAFLMAAMQAAVPGFTPLPTDPPPLPFQVADPEVLRGRMADAGLHGVEVETITWEQTINSAEHLWNVFTSSNPIGAKLVADLSDGHRADVKEVLDGMLRERSGGTPGAVLHADINLGTGTPK